MLWSAKMNMGVVWHFSFEEELLPLNNLKVTFEHFHSCQVLENIKNVNTDIHFLELI